MAVQRAAAGAGPGRPAARRPELLGSPAPRQGPPLPRFAPCSRSRVDRLSGGQFQLLAVWACLGSSAQVVILDEPTNNMDPSAVDALIEPAARLDDRARVLVVTHDERFLSRATTHLLRVGRSGVNFALVFDPLFRVPFLNGLLLALVAPLLGAYVRLRDEWLAALGLAQVTAAGGVLAILVGFHPLAGALGAAALGAGVKGRTEKSGNDVYAVLLLFGWAATLLGAANSTRGEELSHALLDGQLYFTGWENLRPSSGWAPSSPPPCRGCRAASSSSASSPITSPRTAWPPGVHLAFDLLVAMAVALTTESIGVMATFCLVFFPPWVAFRIASGWRRALVWIAVLSVVPYLVAFVVAIVLNQPFGPVFVAALVATGPLRLLSRRRR